MSRLSRPEKGHSSASIPLRKDRAKDRLDHILHATMTLPSMLRSRVACPQILLCLLALFQVVQSEIRPFNLLLEPAVRNAPHACHDEWRMMSLQ